MMPEMDGFETAQLIHGSKRGNHLPIIFLTAAFRDEDHKLSGYGSGAVDYLYKPISPTILLAKAAVFLELAKKNDALKRQFEEPQRWNNVMLDREDRVWELKREVNELCCQLGENVHYPSQETNRQDS